MSDATAAVRAFPVRAAAACPWWCEREHPGGRTTHMADIAEVRNADGFTAQITIVRHAEPDRSDEQLVRVFTCEGDSTAVFDLSPGAAEALGASIMALSPAGSGRAYGMALRRAGAHLLPPGGEQERVRRQAPPVRLVEDDERDRAPAVSGADDGPGDAIAAVPDTQFRLGLLTGYYEAATKSLRGPAAPAEEPSARPLFTRG